MFSHLAEGFEIPRVFGTGRAWTVGTSPAAGIWDCIEISTTTIFDEPDSPGTSPATGLSFYIEIRVRS